MGDGLTGLSEGPSDAARPSHHDWLAVTCSFWYSMPSRDIYDLLGIVFLPFFGKRVRVSEIRKNIYPR